MSTDEIKKILHQLKPYEATTWYSSCKELCLIADTLNGDQAKPLLKTLMVGIRFSLNVQLEINESDCKFRQTDGTRFLEWQTVTQKDLYALKRLSPLLRQLQSEVLETLKSIFQRLKYVVDHQENATLSANVIAKVKAEAQAKVQAEIAEISASYEAEIRNVKTEFRELESDLTSSLERIASERNELRRNCENLSGENKGFSLKIEELHQQVGSYLEQLEQAQKESISANEKADDLEKKYQMATTGVNWVGLVSSLDEFSRDLLVLHILIKSIADDEKIQVFENRTFGSEYLIDVALRLVFSPFDEQTLLTPEQRIQPAIVYGLTQIRLHQVEVAGLLKKKFGIELFGPRIGEKYDVDDPGLDITKYHNHDAALKGTIMGVKRYGCRVARGNGESYHYIRRALVDGYRFPSNAQSPD